MDSESKMSYNPAGLLKEKKLHGIKKTHSLSTLDDFINKVKKGKTNQVNISFKRYNLLKKFELGLRDVLETMPCFSSQVVLDSEGVEFGLYNHSKMAESSWSPQSKRIRSISYDNGLDKVTLMYYNEEVKAIIYKNALKHDTLSPYNERLECEIYRDTLQEGIDIAEILEQSGMVLGTMEGIPLNTKTIDHKNVAATKIPYNIDTIRNNLKDLNNQISELNGIINIIESRGYFLSDKQPYFVPLHQK